MSDSYATFGRAAVSCASSSALVELEAREGRAPRFTAIDTTLAGLTTRSARGDRVVRIVRGDRLDRLEIVGVHNELRAVMKEALRLESQRSRGAWFLPETVKVKAGLVNFASYFRAYPRYAHTLAAEERAKVALDSADAMILWSALEPMFDGLLRPIVLRSVQSGLLTKEDFAASWSEVQAYFDDLGMHLEDVWRVFAWGGGWAHLSADQQLAAKAALLAAMAERIDVDVVRRVRARATRALVHRRRDALKHPAV